MPVFHIGDDKTCAYTYEFSLYKRFILLTFLRWRIHEFYLSYLFNFLTFQDPHRKVIENTRTSHLYIHPQTKTTNVCQCVFGSSKSYSACCSNNGKLSRFSSSLTCHSALVRYIALRTPAFYYRSKDAHKQCHYRFYFPAAVIPLEFTEA